MVGGNGTWVVLAVVGDCVVGTDVEGSGGRGLGVVGTWVVLGAVVLGCVGDDAAVVGSVTGGSHMANGGSGGGGKNFLVAPHWWSSMPTATYVYIDHMLYKFEQVKYLSILYFSYQ